MDRTRSLLRRTYAFGAVAVVSIAVVVLRSAHDVESRTVEHLDATFPAIDFDKTVRRVEVSRTTKKDDKPVEEKVEDALKDLAKVKTRSVPTTNPKKFAEFADKEEGFIDVRVLGEDDAVLLSFGVGRNNAEGSYSNVFLRVDNVGDAGRKGGVGVPGMTTGTEGGGEGSSGKIVTATGLETYTWRDRAQVTPWIESRLFPGLNDVDVADITWSHPPKSTTAVLVRGEKPAKDPKDTSAKEPEEPYLLSLPDSLPAAAKREPAKQLFQSVSGLRLAGLEGVAGAEGDAKYGFDKPDLVVTAKGKAAKPGAPAPIWKVEIGRKVEGKSSYYARRTTSGGAERGGVDKWVFTVEDYEISRFRDDPKDLLEKKPEPPAEPAMAEPAMGEPAMTEPAMTDPAMTEPAMTEPAMTDPAMGDATPPMGEAPAPAPAPAPEGPAMAEKPGEAPPMGEPAPGPK